MSNLKKYYLAIGLFLAFVWLSVGLAAAPALAPAEVEALFFLKPLNKPLWTGFFLLITFLASWPVVVFFGLITVFWLGRFNRLQALIFISAIIAAEAIAILTKTLVKRPRPALAEGVLNLTSFGYPSGHALVGLVFYGLIAYLLLPRIKTFWPRLLIMVGSVSLIILISFSRLYLGVHWPLDVVGGWLAGLAIWLVAQNLSRD